MKITKTFPIMVAINFQKINIELQTFICGLHFCGHAEEFLKNNLTHKWKGAFSFLFEN